MHAHDHLRLIFDQVKANLQDKVMENGHGSMLGGAGAWGRGSDEFLSMYLGGARGMPGRLKCPIVEIALRGTNLAQAVWEAPVSSFVGASAVQYDGLE